MILRIASLQPLRWPAAQPAQRAGRGGGRNARATGPRSRAFPISPGNSPSRIASLPPASPQIIVRQALRVTTFSLNPLWGRMLRAATEKHFPLVRKLWTTRLPCGKLRKSAEEIAREQPGKVQGFTLDAVRKIAPQERTVETAPFTRPRLPRIPPRTPEDRSPCSWARRNLSADATPRGTARISPCRCWSPAKSISCPELPPLE